MNLMPHPVVATFRLRRLASSIRKHATCRRNPATRGIAPFGEPISQPTQPQGCAHPLWSLARRRVPDDQPPATPAIQRSHLRFWGLVSALLCFLLAPSLPAQEKTTYEDNVLPVLRNKCLRCHNADKKKAGLNLSTFATALQGSGNGPVVEAGDPDASLLFKVVSHTEEPFMPPSDKLPDADIATIRNWIAGGLLETSGSKAIVSAKPKLNLALGSTQTFQPDGPPPMPVDVLSPDPYVRTDRTSVSTALDASPWSPLVALGGQHQVFLHNTDTFQLEGVVPFPEGYPHDVKFSANGALLIVGGGRGAQRGISSVWDIRTGEKILTVGDDYDSVLATDISPDQRFIAHGGPDRLVRIFSTGTGQLLHQIKKHTDWVTAIRFSPDSKHLASGDRNGGLHVWDAALGSPLCALNGHNGQITGIAWANTNLLLSTSADGKAKIWKTDEFREIKNWNAHNGGVLALARNQAGLLVTCGRDRKATLWDPNGQRQRDFAFPGDIPSRATLSHDGKRVIGTDWNGVVYVWDAADGRELGRLSLNPIPVAEQWAAAQQEVEKAQADLAKAQAQFQTAQREWTQLTNELARLEQASSTAQTEAQSAQATHQRIEQHQQKVAQSQQELQASERALQTARNDAAPLRARTAFAAFFRARENWQAQEPKRLQLLARIEATQATLAKTHSDLAQARQRDLNALKAEKLAALEKSRQDLAGLQNQSRELESKTQQTQSAKTAAEQAMLAAQQALELRDTELKQAQARFTELDTAAKQKRQETVQAKSNLDEVISKTQKPAQEKVAEAVRTQKQAEENLRQSESAAEQARKNMEAYLTQSAAIAPLTDENGRNAARDRITRLTATIQQAENDKAAQAKRLVDINLRVAQSLKQYQATESQAQEAEQAAASAPSGPGKDALEQAAREKRHQALQAKTSLDTLLADEQQPVLAALAQLHEALRPVLAEKRLLESQLAVVALEKVLADATAHKTQAEQELDKINAEVQQTTQAVASLDQAAQTAETAARDAQAAAEKKAGEIKQAEAALAGAQQQVNQLQTELENLAQQQAGLSETVQRTAQTVALAESDFKNLEPQHAQSLARLAETEQNQSTELTSLQRELDTLTQSQSAREKEVDSLKQTYESLKASLPEMKPSQIPMAQPG